MFNADRDQGAQSNEISAWKSSQHGGKCGATRCPRYAEPGDNYCAPCGPKERARKARSAQRRRDRLKADGKCIENCGNKAKRGRERCARCLKTQSRRVDGRSDRVDGQKRDLPEKREKRGHYKTEVFSDGAARQRYVGQSHRGGPTREEQDTSADKLVLDGHARVQTWIDERIAMRREIDGYPRIQRSEGRQRLYSRLTYVGRQLIQAAAEGGDPIAVEILRLLAPDDAE